jgi:HEAT repeat protein
MEHLLVMELQALKDMKTLMHDLNSSDAKQHMAARDALLTMGREAIPTLVEAMMYRNDRLGWRAAIVLTEMRDPETKPAFVAALDSPNPIIRQVAAQILGKFQDTALVPDLLSHLSDEVSITQMWIIESLGELGDRRALTPLLNLLAQTESETIQQSIIRALGRLGDPKAAPHLLRFINAENRHVRSRARDVHKQLVGYEPGDAQ